MCLPPDRALVKYPDIYFCTFFLSHPKQYRQETRTQNIREFLSRYLALQQARLLACDHYHVIFTLPHDLNALWLANMPVMSALLFQAGRDTLVDLLADPQYLGAQPGIIAALHTWSQTLVLHPHIH